GAVLPYLRRRDSRGVCPPGLVVRVGVRPPLARHLPIRVLRGSRTGAAAVGLDHVRVRARVGDAHLPEPARTHLDLAHARGENRERAVDPLVLRRRGGGGARLPARPFRQCGPARRSLRRNLRGLRRVRAALPPRPGRPVLADPRDPHVAGGRGGRDLPGPRNPPRTPGAARNRLGGPRGRAHLRVRGLTPVHAPSLARRTGPPRPPESDPGSRHDSRTPAHPDGGGAGRPAGDEGSLDRVVRPSGSLPSMRRPSATAVRAHRQRLRMAATSLGPQILFPVPAFDPTIAAPSALVLKCEACGAEAPHRVLRGKIGGKDEIVFEATVKCPNCGRVSTVVTREPKPIEIPLIVSWLDKSERTSLEFSPEENVTVGEALDLGDSRIEVTAVEANGRPVPAARAKEVATVWAKRIDRVRVKFSVNKGHRTV